MLVIVSLVAAGVGLIAVAATVAVAVWKVRPSVAVGPRRRHLRDQEGDLASLEGRLRAATRPRAVRLLQRVLRAGRRIDDLVARRPHETSVELVAACDRLRLTCLERLRRSADLWDTAHALHTTRRQS